MAIWRGNAQNELNSFLWTIKRDPPSYFFGTIHVPYTRVWDFIPENSKKAFQQSHIVYFELDLTDPYTISALTSCQLLPQGKNLQDVLPRDIYRRLKRHLEYVKLMMPSWMTPDQRGKGLYADYLFNAIAGNWEQKRPVWVMLMVNSLTEVDIKSRGVPVLDLFLAQEAERLRKQTGAVEKVEEQCHPLNGLNFSQVRWSGVQGARLAAELDIAAETAWAGVREGMQPMERVESWEGPWGKMGECQKRRREEEAEQQEGEGSGWWPPPSWAGGGDKMTEGRKLIHTPWRSKCLLLAALQNSWGLANQIS
ncbi:hypothetical protein DV515_00011152 [Chloebia gouldiae]|uniref:Metalloprotease TIKI n=1 Tax=Chloebia gouldiae TaxID=44316 RepID=A0A3L8S806_CHLGU|nr:hypothetical protein DV515_00011152 [Chloebia gouldiae]